MANRGAYRMTAARRAALRKAQIASARKRRKHAFIQGAKFAGVIAGGVAVHAINHHLNYAATHPIKTAQGIKKGHAWMQGKLRPAGPVKVVHINPTRRRASLYSPGHRHVKTMAHGQRIRSRVR